MSIEKGLLANEDINFGVGTFTRKGRTGFPITVTQVSDLIAGTSGPLIDARRYTLFTDAVAAAVGKTLLLAAAVSLDANTTIGASTSLLVLQSGVISASGFTLTINGPPVNNPTHQWLSGFAAGEVLLGTNIEEIPIEWVGGGTGKTAAQNYNAVTVALATKTDWPIIKFGLGEYVISHATLPCVKVAKRGGIRGVVMTPYAAATSTILRNTGTTDCMEFDTPGFSSFIEDITLQGNSLSGIGLVLDNADNTRVTNVMLGDYSDASRGHGSHGLRIKKYSYWSRFENFWSCRNGGDGINIGTVYSEPTNDIRFRDVSVLNNAGRGIYAKGVQTLSFVGSADVEGNGGLGVHLDTDCYIVSTDNFWIEGNNGGLAAEQIRIDGGQISAHHRIRGALVGLGGINVISGNYIEIVNASANGGWVTLGANTSYCVVDLLDSTAVITDNGAWNQFRSHQLALAPRSTNYIMTGTDGVAYIEATSSATITLPPCNGSRIRTVTIAKGDTSGTITIQRAGSDTIVGGTSITMTGQYSSRVLVGSDGRWIIAASVGS